MINIPLSSFRLWITSVLLFDTGTLTYITLTRSIGFSGFLLDAILVFSLSIILSIPVFLTYLITLAPINRLARNSLFKAGCICMLNITMAFLYTIFYASEFLIIEYTVSVFKEVVLIFLGLSCSSLLALLLNYSFLQKKFFISTTNKSIMYTSNDNPTPPSAGNNRILYKAIVTGVLILAMMIPMIFVSNLVQEREARRKEVEKDVSQKWAAPQTVSGPYLYVPYIKQVKDVNGKPSEIVGDFFILPEQLSITGNIDTEERKRSIYKVLLYKTQVAGTGSFQLQIPKGINAEEIQWKDIKLCVGISDFKGIEKEIKVNFKDNQLSLLPGLPSTNIDSNGLSVNIALSASDLGTSIPFTTTLALRGSAQLHFMPLAGNSQFNLRSKWLSPSFDGNTIPTSRKVDKTGFFANWSFNKANLPFNTLVTDAKTINASLAFGVSLLQPGDQYAQTDRCSKYAILLIGLSFALFFIMEIMQNKPVHPVQYVLVGLALIIFYTLLLSISEIASFDLAYFVAASATILLITVYVHSHFQQAKTAAYFTVLLSLLYGFIFILLRLEDTALLVGSIGLFIILAIVMYASRRINWYQPVTTTTVTA